jgi:hypothetical protein
MDVIVGLVLLVVAVGALVETTVRVLTLRKAGVRWGDPRYKRLRWSILGIIFFGVIAYAHLRPPS